MTLSDTGPLVSLLSGRDDDHARCAATLSMLTAPLVTTWPCLGEAMYLLGKFGGYSAQDPLWEYLTDGTLHIHFSDEAERHRMRFLMRQYADTPMDLADASLVAAAETLHLQRIFTLDSDFFIYRMANGAALEVVPSRRNPEE